MKRKQACQLCCAFGANIKVFVPFFKKNLRESERESFDQTFSKVCGFQRQSLWPFSAENGTPDDPKTQEATEQSKP
ncbi:MAG TPA: hypothetical protein IAB66_06890 [Candidatus Caccousia avistercoris]|nr:hypothetical protein [Candidatus Caccousia avistercoris]